MTTDTLAVPANKGRKLPPELLSPDEVRALLRACSSGSPTGARNRALLVTLYRGGLRLDEALGLRPGDIDFSEGVIRVRRGPRGGNGEHRAVGIDAAALAVIGAWLEFRVSLGLAEDRPLFCTLSGGALHPAYVRQLLPRLAEKAGIDKRVHAQGLRQTHAAELAAESRRRLAAPMDTIILTGIRALGCHGALPEEQTRPQPFEVDVELSVDLSTAGRSDLLSDTIDYDGLTAQVVQIIEAGGLSLLEALADRIATACRADPRVTGVAVTVKKLRPPVPVQIDHVAVRIER